jgi:hypothetical protein
MWRNVYKTSIRLLTKPLSFCLNKVAWCRELTHKAWICITGSDFLFHSHIRNFFFFKIRAMELNCKNFKPAIQLKLVSFLMFTWGWHLSHQNLIFEQYSWKCILKTKLHGLSPRANYTDRATTGCRRSDCQLLRIEGAMWSAWRIPIGRILGFLDRSRYFSIK